MSTDFISYSWPL